MPNTAERVAFGSRLRTTPLSQTIASKSYIETCTELDGA